MPREEQRKRLLKSLERIISIREVLAIERCNSDSSDYDSNEDAVDLMLHEYYNRLKESRYLFGSRKGFP